MTAPGPQEAHATLVRLAERAGRAMRETLGAVSTPKGDGSPVTSTDLAINAAVIEEVQRVHDGCGVLGEEGSVPAGNGGVFVVDPVDGTQAFSAGLCVAAFSCAYVLDGEVVAAVVEDPWAQMRFAAVHGEGATLNGSELVMPERPTFNLVNVEGTSGPGIPATALEFALRRNGYTMCRYRAFVSPACRVATGAFSAAVFARPSPWDCAAVSFIIDAAGGTVSALDATRGVEASVAGGLVAAHRDHHSRVLDAVLAARAASEQG